VAAGMAVSPGGHLFVADRHETQLFVLGPSGERAPFARFTDGDFPRALAFAPVTAETQRAGIAGDLFVVIINRSAWPVNEVIRVSGPFEGFVRSRLPARPQALADRAVMPSTPSSASLAAVGWPVSGSQPAIS